MLGKINSRLLALFFFAGILKDWWKPETSDNFKEKAQCIIWQYGNYTKLGMNLNGINTQGENIADNGGIKEAYLGYGTQIFMSLVQIINEICYQLPIS